MQPTRYVTKFWQTTPDGRFSLRRSHILQAFCKLDDIDKVPLIYCEANELVKLPPVTADPVSELVIANSACLKEIEGRISQLHDDLAGLRTLTARVETSISSTPSPPSSYAAAVGASVSNVSGFSGHRVSRPDRAENLMIFGLPEAECLPDFKRKVDELLNFLTGRPVPVKDLYRLDHRKNTSNSSTPTSSRPRPVLLKLMSSWDRRLVLSAVRDFKGYSVKGIFVREDLSPEERLKRRGRNASRTASAVATDSNPRAVSPTTSQGPGPVSED